MALAVFFILVMAFAGMISAFAPLIGRDNIALRVLGSFGTLAGFSTLCYMLWHQKAVYDALLTLPGLGG